MIWSDPASAILSGGWSGLLRIMIFGTVAYVALVIMLRVTSREVVRVFLKQLWFQFVPVFHGLQGRSTMKN